MTKGINLIINETKEELLHVINNSNLPIGVTVMILGNILTTAQTLEKDVLKKEEKAFIDEQPKTGISDIKQ